MMRTTLVLTALATALFAACSSEPPKQDVTAGSALDLKPQSSTQAARNRSDCAQVAADIESLLADRNGGYQRGTSGSYDPLTDMRLQSLEAKGDGMGCDTSRYVRDRMTGSPLGPSSLPRGAQ